MIRYFFGRALVSKAFPWTEGKWFIDRVDTSSPIVTTVAVVLDEEDAKLIAEALNRRQLQATRGKSKGQLQAPTPAEKVA